MEIYTNASAPERRVSVPFTATATAIDVYAYSNGTQVFEFTTVTPEADGSGYYVTIPLFLNQFDSELTIQWSLTYLEPANDETYTVHKLVSVKMITPILTPAEIRGVWDTASDAEVVRIEKAVRHIIQAYTGQEFGYFVGEYSVKSIGGHSLRLPRRLIQVDSFEGSLLGVDNFIITDGGYTLRYNHFGVPPVKADYYGLHIHTGGVIHNPNSIHWREFDAGHDFRISGKWGWEAIPEPVKEAAKLLVNDYACADSQYRDRYLVSMTAADWRIQFHSGAYLRTGNVRADQLLSEFVTTRGWGVI